MPTFFNSPSNLTRTLSLWALALSLYAFYIWGHIPISNICYALSDQYTPAVYRHYVLLTGKALLGIIILMTCFLIINCRQKVLKASVWGLFSLALFFSYDSLVKISIEYIHFIQYCGLSLVLCYIFPKRLVIAFLLALFAGLMDEVYQAYPKDPMNWRDTLLNVTGVIWGGLIYWTLQDSNLA